MNKTTLRIFIHKKRRGGINWEIGTDTLPLIKQVTNMDLLHSAENSRFSIFSNSLYGEKKSKKKKRIYI